MDFFRLLAHDLRTTLSHRAGALRDGNPRGCPVEHCGSPYGFSGHRAAQYRTMDLRKPVLLLALIGSLVACGQNSDLERGETDCDSTSDQAANSQDESCEETGTPAK